MEKQKNIPVLRFPEFTDTWKTKKLGELLEFKNGINASKEKYGQGVKFINVLDILNNEFITYEKIIGCVDVDRETVNKYPVNYGDILFQRSSETREEVGSACVYLDNHKTATFGGFVIRGRKIGEYIPVFLNQLLKTDIARNDITSKSGGSTRYNVGQEILTNVSLPFPSLDEQIKIANLITAINDQLTQLKQKKTLLEQYKKGVMQKIFNQEIRFKDEDGSEYPDWEEKSLGEISTIKKGEQLNVSELTESGKYPALNGGINASGYTDKWNTESNTITISEGGNSCGYVNFNVEKFWCGGHCYAVLNIDSEIDLNYLFQVLKYNEASIMHLRVGSGLPNIQKKDLNDFSLQIPKLLEQIKIANFLSTLDEKIKCCGKQIEKTEAYKKGLLQQMFV